MVALDRDPAAPTRRLRLRLQDRQGTQQGTLRAAELRAAGVAARAEPGAAGGIAILLPVLAAADPAAAAPAG